MAISGIEHKTGPVPNTSLKNNGELITIEGIPEGHFAFNPAAPDQDSLPIRLGWASDERASHVAVCRRSISPDGRQVWAIDDRRIIQGEDPFYTKIQDHRGRERILFGCVRTGTHPLSREPNTYYTCFWVIKDWEDIQYLANTPPEVITPAGQKGVRPFLHNRRLNTFLRPQGNYDQGGAGVINFVPGIELADLSLPALYNPQEYQVKGLESICDRKHRWAGVNAVYPTGDRLFLLLHFAHRAGVNNPLNPSSSIDAELRVYRAFVGTFNPVTNSFESLHLVCTAADLPDSQTRQIDGLHPDNLRHVVYPGGINDGYLYVGTRDAASGKIPIATPRICGK